MREHTSLYLDVLRILAAAAVFLSHLTRDTLSTHNSLVLAIGQYGQEGVAIFFVISGLVIAFVAHEKERDFRSYIVARLGRLWSVIVPALILTVILDTVGRGISPEMYVKSGIQAWAWDMTSVWNFLAPLFFLNQAVFGAVDPGTNGPFWSLSFEFWYYMIFGVAYYVRGIPRLLLVTAAAATAGPNILFLFPIWIFGLMTYAYLTRPSSARLHAGAWGASCLMLLFFMLFKHKIGVAIASAFPESGASGETIAGWISHFAVGCVCAVNIAIYDRCGGVALFQAPPAERCIRFLAARSFSLYLYQAPCLFFFGAMTYGMHATMLRLSLVVALSLLTIFLLAEVTERRKKLFIVVIDRLIPASIPGLPRWQIREEIVKNNRLVK
jgi:peptidoglycan/LPS O-acetylase OafA/YrhL